MAHSKPHQEILDKFVEKLKADKAFDVTMDLELREALESGSKVRPAMLAAIRQKEHAAK